MTETETLNSHKYIMTLYRILVQNEGYCLFTVLSLIFFLF